MPGSVGTSLPSVSEPPTAKTVTSWPRRTRSRVSSHTSPSMLPLPWRATGVARVEIWAIRMLSGRNFQERREDLGCVEIFLSKSPRAAAGALIIGVDGFDAADRLVQIAEGNNSLAEGKPAGQAGVFQQRGAAGGKVARGAVAEPAPAHEDVPVLGDAELGAGFLDESAVGVRRAGGEPPFGH